MTATTDTTPKSPEREEAELAKIRLETQKLQLDVQSAILAQQRGVAEVRSAIAAAQMAEHDTAIRAITRKQQERQEFLSSASDLHHNHFLFDGPVDQKSVYACLATVNAWHRNDPTGAWHITMNSGGGSAIDGMHLFDTLRAHSLRGEGTHEITMTVRGYAASMAGILLQAVDNRVIGREAWLMIHEISAGTSGKVGEMQDRVKWFEKMCGRVANIFVERAEGKIDLPSFTSKWERADWWLSSEESLELGFVDRIG